MNSPDSMLQAFDYVTGVLRGAERAAFEQQLAQDDQLQAEVRFWEEQLIHLSAPAPIAPDPEVWQALERRIKTGNAQVTAQTEGLGTRLKTWFKPVRLIATAASLLLALNLWLLWVADPLQAPNADYVAVLTNSRGEPQLTVLTAHGGGKLWLKWDKVSLAPDKNLQLWAVSRRDGQVRSLGVFDNTGAQQLPLENARWRLIKDAEYLLLTEEEPGGSPLDEPSDQLLAKGVCVLLAQI